MGRKIEHKNLNNTRILNEYGSWIYCDNCNQTIAYLCYVSYDHFLFHYTCNCGNNGSVEIKFEKKHPSIKADEKLEKIKNRLCCPKDKAPLITVLDSKLKKYNFTIDCNICNSNYNMEKES